MASIGGTDPPTYMSASRGRGIPFVFVGRNLGLRQIVGRNMLPGLTGLVGPLVYIICTLSIGKHGRWIIVGLN